MDKLTGPMKHFPKSMVPRFLVLRVAVAVQSFKSLAVILEHCNQSNPLGRPEAQAAYYKLLGQKKKMNAHTYTYICVHIFTYVTCNYMCVYIYRYIWRCVYIYIHTRIITCLCVCVCLSILFLNGLKRFIYCTVPAPTKRPCFRPSSAQEGLLKPEDARASFLSSDWAEPLGPSPTDCDQTPGYR